MSKRAVIPLVLVISLCSLMVAEKSALAVTSENTWETMAPMPTARSNIGVAAVNGRIYAIGGAVASGATAVNEMYDPATNTWTNKQPMPTPRYGFGITVYLNKVYCIGGFAESGPTLNEVYDPATDSWATLKSMPTSAGFSTANSINGKIYVLGAQRASYSYSLIASTQVYDIATDTWETKAPMPTPAMFSASTTISNRIYVMGGANNEAVFWSYEPINVLQIYDSENDTWSYGTALPVGTEAPAAAVTSGIYAPERIYVLGGSDWQSHNYNFVYDPVTDSWSNGTQMPTPRGRFGVAVVDDILYALGGTGRLNGDPAIVVNQKYTPFGYRGLVPIIQIISPEQNVTYDASNVTLTFNVDRPFVDLHYSINNEANVTIEGNVTLADLPTGANNMTVYAVDVFGNVGASDTVLFNVTTQSSDALSTTVIITSGATLTAVGAGILVYFKKRKKQAKT